MHAKTGLSWGHALQSAPRPGPGPSEKVDPGPLEKVDPIPKNYCMS